MTVVMQIMVYQQIVESGRKVVVVVAAACETCLRGGGYGYDYDCSPEYYFHWNQETQNFQAVKIVVRLNSKRIRDSLEPVSVNHLHLEFLSLNCSMLPSMFFV